MIFRYYPSYINENLRKCRLISFLGLYMIEQLLSLRLIFLFCTQINFINSQGFHKVLWVRWVKCKICNCFIIPRQQVPLFKAFTSGPLCKFFFIKIVWNHCWTEGFQCSVVLVCRIYKSFMFFTNNLLRIVKFFASLQVWKQAYLQCCAIEIKRQYISTL